MAYDKNNIFAKILRGEIPCKKIYENDSNKVHEAADVLYLLMVLLEANGIKIEDVIDELKKRQK